METLELSKFARDVRDFHELSGLSWDQVGRCLGVSSRTAQWWSTGHAKTVKGAAERVSLLLADVVALELPTALERRMALLRTEGSSSVLSDWICKEQNKNYVIQFSSWNMYNTK